MLRNYVLFFLVLGLYLGCNKGIRKEDHDIKEVAYTRIPPELDGIADDPCWEKGQWHLLDQNWKGDTFSPDDFQGRYKLSWSTNSLHLLVEIIDDSLFDKQADPLKLWWDDDSVEIFLDEDNSGGLHQYSHNAFAYHVALDGNVVDVGPSRKPRLYNDHLKVARRTVGKKSTWEMSVALFPDTYNDDQSQTRVQLYKDKRIGFALAYCDNDGSKERENFIGSVFVPGDNKNTGWINADIFGTLVLVE
ncbi:sugar-binding protein [Zeaxanthinibacter enoshimensis]|uniref:Carbohydrate binding protein with CBM9 domain n=1 Tax=Zeaxanthinibacter enoshimensis TaxID=392009 RepID=A0A4R6TJ17_9FLAO|nr:sugar-binding protein [Zeaxanthinibacter enoshimensis]TDQ29270.1 carbohydrate binding protein with CBM9 domain [Zeaxanthinibacter enoshimensis]